MPAMLMLKWLEGRTINASPRREAMRILVIEDEPRMLHLLLQGLRERGFAVMTARDGQAGLAIAADCAFDAIVLDLGLPDIDGYEIIRELRTRTQRIPVLVLTARDAEDDIIRGLSVGADDYMTKPFSFPELVARLECIGRIKPEPAPAHGRSGQLVLDGARRTAFRGHDMIELTRSEFLLLACLLQNAGQCVERKLLMQAVWGVAHGVGPGALDVLVNAVRSKIDAPYPEKLLATVRGTGYILRHASSAAESVPR